MDNQKSEDHRKLVGEWLSLPYEWRIPVYQRHYAWDATDDSGPIHLFWETVREQTIARLGGENPPPHYLGAVLVDNRTERNATDGITRYDVVDGQQRLTTIQIALLALIPVAKEYGLELSTKETLKRYIFSDEAQNNPRLSPTNFDEERFKDILLVSYGKFFDKPNRENALRSKIAKTSKFLENSCKYLVRKQQEEHDEGKVIDAIMKTLTEGFDLVRIVLRDTDKAQKIFESLNNYAKPLTTFDLIRNHVFYRAACERTGMDVELFNKREWQRIEQPYWEEKADNRKTDSATHIEAYIARMLVAKMKKEFRFQRNVLVKYF